MLAGFLKYINSFSNTTTVFKGDLKSSEVLEEVRERTGRDIGPTLMKLLRERQGKHLLVKLDERAFESVAFEGFREFITTVEAYELREDYKKCVKYQEGVKQEGSLFRCGDDPYTAKALQKQWAGCWCVGCDKSGLLNKKMLEEALEKNSINWKIEEEK